MVVVGVRMRQLLRRTGRDGVDVHAVMIQGIARLRNEERQR
jgi:hypothetical protein